MVDYSNIPRDSRRVPLATKVQFKFDRFSGFISEYSANISPTGMFIVSSNPEPLGRVLDLEFRLGDGFEIIQGKGEVVWSRAVADGPNRPPGMGLRFAELSEGSKDLIYRIVDRYVQEGGTPFDLTTARDRIDEPPPPAFPAFPEAPAPAMAAPATAAPAITPGVPVGQVFSDLPPLDLEQNPFPDLGVDPVKDSSGNALPWFSAAPGEMPAAGPALRQEEDPLELFPSIGPALEEVEETFARDAAGRVPPREEPTAPAPSPPAPLLFPSAAPAPAGPAELFASFDPLLPTTPTIPAALEPAEPPASLSAPGLFADYLPKAASPSEAPPPRTLASVAGSATAHEPRRTSPLLLVIGLLALLGAGAFLLRDRIAGWLGLGGEDERIASAQVPPRPLHPHKKLGAAAPPVAQDGLTSEAAAATTTDPGTAAKPAAPEPAAPVQTPAASPPAVSPPTALATGAPAPEVVQRKRPPAPTPATGPALTAVDRITYEESFGGTDIVLWGNGAIRPESYVHSQMGSPPRELFRITGIRKPFPQVKIPVGTGEVKQVRIGYHEAPKGNELHVVIDLAGPQVKVTRVDQDGQRLRIHLQKG